MSKFNVMCKDEIRPQVKDVFHGEKKERKRKKSFKLKGVNIPTI